MSIDNLPQLTLPALGSVRDPSRPVFSFAWRAAEPHRASAHSHARGHVIQPESGAYWVSTPEGAWLVPPGQAIWIPPEVHHEVYSHGAVVARVLLVDPSCAGGLPPRCGTVKVSPLLAELLLRIVRYGNNYEPDGPAARLALVMLDELAAMELAPLLVPISKDPRLARVMTRLVDNPASDESLDTLARHAGASARTLARLFHDETGMSFAQWKTQLRLVESIERLARGEPVTSVAVGLGYTVSSFVYMFRQRMGVPPGRYLASIGNSA